MGVLVIAGVAAPGLLGEDQLVDLFQLFGGIFVTLGNVGIFALFAGGAALVAGAPTHDSGYHLVALVGVDGLHVLNDQGSRVLAVFLLNIQHPLDAVDVVTGTDVAEELPIGAGEEAVDPRQAPAGPAGPVAHEGSARVTDHGAVFGIRGVFLVPEHGVAVADAVHEIDHRAHGSIPDEVFGAQPDPDHCFGVGDHLGGDPRYLRQGLSDPFLFVLLCHIDLGGLLAVSGQLSAINWFGSRVF